MRRGMFNKKSGLKKLNLPLPSLGFFFMPNSGDPLANVGCCTFGLRPAAK